MVAIENNYNKFFKFFENDNQFDISASNDNNDTLIIKDNQLKLY